MSGSKQNWLEKSAKQNADIRLLAEWKSYVLKEVRSKINTLKTSRYRPSPNKVLDDKKVQVFLDDFHQKFVITPTDKAGNNFSIVCKTFYIQCLLKELGISEQKKGSTYECIEEKTEEDIVQDHKAYMAKHNIPLSSTQEALPFPLLHSEEPEPK